MQENKTKAVQVTAIGAAFYYTLLKLVCEFTGGVK